MKNKLKIVLITLIIFNVIVAGFLVLDIQTFVPPKTNVKINLIDISSEALTLETIVNIQNKNSFDLSIKDFEVVSNTENGEEIGRIKIIGGDIKANNNKTFYSQDNFILKNENITVLKNRLTAEVSLKFFGLIQKTIPLEIEIETSLNAIIDQLKQPEITIHTDLKEIYDKGLNFTTTIDIYNPTHFLYDIKEIFFNIENEVGENLGKIILQGRIIEPLKTITLLSDGTIFFDALDAKVLWLKLNGVAGVKIAGLYKKLNISADTTFTIPDIKDFIFGNNSIDFNMPVQFKLTLRGILSNIGFQMYNPSNITLTGENLICSILRKDKETYSILGQSLMKPCIIHPQEKICVKTNITIPYLDFLRAGKRRLRPDWIVLRIEGDFYISGTRQAVPISLNAYVDPHIILNRNFDNA